VVVVLVRILIMSKSGFEDEVLIIYYKYKKTLFSNLFYHHNRLPGRTLGGINTASPRTYECAEAILGRRIRTS
jgi:hypothetical protein